MDTAMCTDQECLQCFTTLTQLENLYRLDHLSDVDIDKNVKNITK
jgi:hypothetical protein